MSNIIKVITFDLWDTVFIDDSDEPKRKQAGRPPKRVERRKLVHQFINKHEPISYETVCTAYDTADAAFRKVWHDQFVTWSVQARLAILFKGLGKTLPDFEMQELIRLHEEMELEFRPDFVNGVHNAIKALAKKYRLAVISDAIFSPGRALRTLLEGEGLLDYFDVFVFSDEVGHSKPEPIVFETVCQKLNVEPGEIVHIGDREHNDILGPKRLGARAVLCTAAINRGSEHTKADARFSDYSKLEQIIDNLNNK
ncbi:HAD family hydrolase [candidate division KSB1 bacterium]|nr:HAD family hydrolase [candidate division KSB1 bacterium]